MHHRHALRLPPPTIDAREAHALCVARIKAADATDLQSGDGAVLDGGGGGGFPSRTGGGGGEENEERGRGEEDDAFLREG